jgi:hypothetical protein
MATRLRIAHFRKAIRAHGLVGRDLHGGGTAAVAVANAKITA